MSLVTGPFKVRWGSNTITNVEEIEFDYNRNSTDLDTIQGVSINVKGTIQVSVTLTLLSTDIASLAALLPQYFVPAGYPLSNGHIVECEDGAIDIEAATCGSTEVVNDLIIDDCTGEDCGRMTVRATTVDVEDIEFSDNVRKVMVTFRGTTNHLVTFGGPVIGS